MDTESGDVSGTSQARRSIVAVCLTIALFASAVTFLVDGALPAIMILTAVAAVFAAFRGLPDALLDIAAQRRGSSYFKTLSFVLPIGGLVVSIYLVWLFWRIRRSELLDALPLEIILGLLVSASLLNLAVIVLNAFRRIDI